MRRGSSAVQPLLAAAWLLAAAATSSAQCLEWTPRFPYANAPLGEVYASCVYDSGGGPVLYVAGAVTTAGGMPAHYIASWNGAAWSDVGGGMDSPVNALAVYDDGSGPALYAGGAFFHAGGSPARRFAKWNGAGWSEVGGGANNIVEALAVWDDGSGPALYAAGRFSEVGGHPALKVARWNGSSWSPLGTGIATTGEVLALAVHDDGSGPKLYAGGSFTEVNGSSTSALRIARWNGSSWSAVGSGIDDPSQAAQVGSLASFDDGTGPALYAGGYFRSVGGLFFHSIARWSGSAWNPVGAGFLDQDPLGNIGEGGVWALAVLDDGRGPGLFAGGYLDTSADVPLHNVARWNGSAWTPLRGGLTDFNPNHNPHVWTLCAFDEDGDGVPDVHVGGFFTTSDGIESFDLASWRSCGGPGTLTCASDSSGASCPCGNAGATGRGCRNSAGAGGALLFGSGSTSPDTLSMSANGVIGSALTILLQGDAGIAPTSFGDGLRCAGGHLLRLYSANAVSGVVVLPGPGDPPITQRSAQLGDPLPPGAQRTYQVYYRDPSLTFCPAPAGATWNATNAAAIRW